MSKRDDITLNWTPENGKLRQKLYAAAVKKADAAIKGGFYIEAIALYESMLSDRLEAHIRRQNVRYGGKGTLKTVGNAASAVKSNTSQKRQPELYQICKEIADWAKGRNEAVHHVVKLTEANKEISFDVRYESYHLIATKGKSLFDRYKQIEKPIIEAWKVKHGYKVLKSKAGKNSARKPSLNVKK